MRRLCFFIFIITFVNYGFLTTEAQSVAQAFIEHEVVPDVLPTPPTEYLIVKYSSGVEAQQGNELTPTQVKDIPTVSWDASPEQLYTVAMTDPDAPSRQDPTMREWLHWLVGNVPGNDVASGVTIAQYVGAGPPLDTGLHRYVLLVYKQPHWLRFDEPRLNNTSTEGRGLFSVVDFAEKYNLGDPIAGNFFQAEYDDYVPILMDQLSGIVSSSASRGTYGQHLLALNSLILVALYFRP